MYHLEVAVSKCRNVSAPFELSIASATVSSMLVIITIPTNLLVCLAILIDPNRELRTQFNCFTLNLALADLLVGCVTDPVSVYAHITEALDTERKHEVNPVVLKLFHIPYFISAMASVLSIAALALERYLAVTSPFRYRQYFNVKLTVILSATIWLISIIFGLLNLLLGYILECFIFINTGVLFTAAVVFFASCRIRSTLRKMSNNRKELGIQRQSTSREDDVQMKLTKTFVLIIGALLCCYVPACSMVYFMNVCPNCDCYLIQWFRDAVFWLVLLNSAINPFVYAFRSSSFRDAIRELVHCRCHQDKKPQRTFLVRYAKGARKGMEPTSARATSYGSVSTGSDEDASDLERVQLI